MDFQIGGLYQIKLNGVYEVYHNPSGRASEWLCELKAGDLFVCFSREDEEYFLPRIQVLIGGMVGVCWLSVHPKYSEWPENGIAQVDCFTSEGIEEVNVH